MNATSSRSSRENTLSKPSEADQISAHDMESSIVSIQGLVDGAVREVAAVISLALCALERPESYRDLESLAATLELLRSRVEDLGANVTTETELVGVVSSFHEPQLRRLAAYAEYRQSIVDRSVAAGRR